MTLSLVFALALTVVQPTASLQQTPEQTPAQSATMTNTGASEAADEADSAELDERVCRTEAVVGTRFSSRTCMTRREWNERRDASRRLAQRMETANSRRDFRAPASASGR